MTGQYAPRRRLTARQRERQTIMAVLGGVTGLIALVVLFIFFYMAGQNRKTEPVIPRVAPAGANHAAPAASGGTEGVPSPSDPRDAAAPAEPAGRPGRPPVEPEGPLLAVHGRPTCQVEGALGWVLLTGEVHNMHAQPVEEASVRVALRSSDGRQFNPPPVRVKMIPPGGTRPFTLRMRGLPRGAKVLDPEAADFQVDGEPDGEDGWVQIRVLTPPTVRDGVWEITGRVQNDTNTPLGQVRVVCDLYRGGEILLSKEATLGDPGAGLRPGRQAEYKLSWTPGETGNEALDFGVTVSAMARRPGN